MTNARSDVPSPSPVIEAGVGPVRWAGYSFNAELTIDIAALGARQRSGLGAITSWPVIDALSSLPHGMEVPWTSMDPGLRSRIETLDTRLVARSPSGATATVTWPCEATRLIATGRSWQRVEAVAPLTQYAPVHVVVSRHPRDTAPAVEAAKRTGVGLTVSRTSGEWLELAAPRRRTRLSSSRTRFIEVLFAAWLRLHASIDADTSEPEPSLQLLGDWLR